MRSEYDEAIEDLEERLAKVSGQGQSGQWGTTNFLVTGYAFVGYTDSEGENSTFSAGFNPIFLWKLSDRLFFEAEIEFELEGDETETNLEYANLSYIVNDYLTVTGGKFLNPSKFFMERLHPLWINKLPDKPLPFRALRIQAPSQLGAQVRGAVPLNSMKCEYAVYSGNGATLETEDPDETEMLEFNNFEDSKTARP